ncbi:sensor histidine kinase [Aggregatimonas sangjinii]|uniref:Sensor histidine kinase n=1 Tax=Aggregatimonas sangjinii TaxID=2583587 RepID=A0A5B7SVR7_9FLAO|nr:histidine kinase [Aggregatimonas sangjinii]QCX00940.1 sensor histidine kinase [Aggregatimonas sangjinii]
MRSISRNIRLKELLAILLFYFAFSLLYHIVLWYTSYANTEEGIWGWIDAERYWLASGEQYAFFFLLSIIIWFLGIYLLRTKRTPYQMLAVFLLIPPGIYFVREFRYGLIDAAGQGRLRGNGEAWDLYIPLLFLFFQFGCFFAYRYFKENQQKIRVEGELRQAALKSELSAIKAQLNPHFLYNVFNTINASIPSEHEKTRDMIAELSDLFRYQLKASQQEYVTLREELAFVRKYLNLEKARFEDRLRIHIDVAEHLMEEQVPPMLLQPLVENSVKHGLASLIEGGDISITIFKEEGKLRFEISDTGVGIADKSDVFDKGIGLQNTRLRLQKMYESHLELIDNTPQGLTIRFSI